MDRRNSRSIKRIRCPKCNKRLTVLAHTRHRTTGVCGGCGVQFLFIPAHVEELTPPPLREDPLL